MEQKEKAITSVKNHIASLKSAAAVITDPLLGNQLMNKYAQMYSIPLEDAQRFYEREKDNFGKIISQNPALQKCTGMSAYLAFGKVLSLNLTFDNGRNPLVYLIPGKRNIGTKEKPVWIEEMVAQPSPEGEKEARIHTGILKKVGQPIIVHEGDKYREFLDADGELAVEWERTEKSNNKIIGSFIRIVEPDGTVIFKTFKPSDIERWKRASEIKNSKWDDNLRKKVPGQANALYTSGPDHQIDEGFLKGKTLLHSFKGYKQVDYGTRPDGFVVDATAAKQINPEMLDENLTEYEDVIETANIAEPDEFQQAVNEAPEERASVRVETSGDDDDLFNN